MVLFSGWKFSNGNLFPNTSIQSWPKIIKLVWPPLGLAPWSGVISSFRQEIEISLPSLHDYDVKCLISRFTEDVNKRWLIFLSLSKRKCGPEKINSRVRNSPTLFWHFHRIGINATVFEKTRIHFKSDVLASVAFNDAKAP